MTGLNQKTTVSIETITTQTDAIIAKLDSMLDVLIESRDYTSTLSDKLTVIAEIEGTTRDRTIDMLAVSVETRDLTTTQNDLVQDTLDEIAAFRNDYGIVAVSSDGYLYQIKALLGDYAVPYLENIFNSTSLTADNVIALSCICDNTNPALMPISDGENSDAELRCQRAQAFMDKYITAVMDVKETLEQTGRVTTAIAGVLLGTTLIPGIDFATIPGTAIAAIVGALAAAGAFKIVQFLSWLQDNRDALTNALALRANASGGQAEWYGVVDSTLHPITQLDLKLLAKLVMWTGLANYLYDTTIDIGESGYDGEICEPEAETFSEATVLFARYILPDNGTLPNGDWSASTWQGTIVIHSGVGVTDIPAGAPYASYALVDTLPPDHSPIGDFDLSGWWYDTDLIRLRFRFDPDDVPSAPMHMVSQTGTEVDSKLFYTGGWIEPVDAHFENLVSVRAGTWPVGGYIVQVQKYADGIWQALA